MREPVPHTEAELSILNRLERVPFGRFQRRLLWMGATSHTKAARQ
jgi:hypothetical protein